MSERDGLRQVHFECPREVWERMRILATRMTPPRSASALWIAAAMAYLERKQNRRLALEQPGKE